MSTSLELWVEDEDVKVEVLDAVALDVEDLEVGDPLELDAGQAGQLVPGHLQGHQGSQAARLVPNYA